MFSSAMIAPLSDAQQEFLTVMGLADEFTVEMALLLQESGSRTDSFPYDQTECFYHSFARWNQLPFSPYDEGMYTACLCHAFP